MLKKALNEPTGIVWNLTTRLKDLDYADDVCLMTHTISDMWRKQQRWIKNQPKENQTNAHQNAQQLRSNSEQHRD